MTAQGTVKAAETRGFASPSDSPASAAAAPVIRAENLRKVFRSGDADLTVLAGVNLSVREGELVAIVGPSGSGKSTLLHILAALDTPTSGAIYFAGQSLHALADVEISEFRNRHAAFVWQRHHLLPDFTAAENVAMPLLLRGTPAAEAMQVARQWLDEVGLTARTHNRAGELSGGEQQRVAFARALVGQPSLLLADEPTGDLDEGNAEAIFELMQRLHRSHRLTSILATHNLALARRCHSVFQLEHGILEQNGPAGLRGAQAQGENG